MIGTHPLTDGLPEPWAVEWGEDRFGVFMGFGVGTVVQRLRWVRPGRFTMGSPEGEAGRFSGEGPEHEVELPAGFWLADTPVTQALWEAVMGENPSRFRGADRPVEQVSWKDCQRFVARLNESVPGLDARLPSEAEWEYACRAGTATATWAGDLTIRDARALELDGIAWYGANSGLGTRPVRGKRPNPFGLFDMLGNVYEWCEGWYGAYSAAPAIDPRGPRSGSFRVLRGGSWSSRARSVRAARRYAYAPGNHVGSLGLRLARGRAPSQGTEPPSA